jgi:mannan polymerase complexes MNN9 subunit
MKRRRFNRTPVLLSLAVLLICLCVFYVRRFSSADRLKDTSKLDSHLNQLQRSKAIIDLSDRDVNRENPHILILTPVKNSAKHLSSYFTQLLTLTYPFEYISIGIMDSDSTDNTVELLNEFKQKHGSTFHSIKVFSHNFGLDLLRERRHDQEKQLKRRMSLAKSRNHLLISTLVDEIDYVLWLDSDVQYYPPTIIQTLLSSKKSIVVPNCVMSLNGGRSYDLNSWRFASLGNNATINQIKEMHDTIHRDEVKNKRFDQLHLEGYSNDKSHLSLSKLRNEGEIVRLDAVGGAMLLVSAELHRHGLIFPPFPYRHRIETEGLSMMALDMGVLSWGMPNVEILHR